MSAHASAPTADASGVSAAPADGQRHAPSSRSPRAGFAALTAEAERCLVDALGLAPLPIDSDLAAASGTWKGAPVRVESRAYSGRVVRYARFVVVTGPELEIGNVLCLSRAEYALPIFGADLVDLGTRAGTSLVAADLSPTLPASTARDAQLADLAGRLAPYGDLPPGGALPDWCTAWFSPHALYVRPHAAALPRAAEAFRHFPRAYTDLAQSARPAPEMAPHVAAVQRGYAAAHRTDDKGLGLLARMFSPAWAERFVREVLFPE